VRTAFIKNCAQHKPVSRDQGNQHVLTFKRMVSIDVSPGRDPSDSGGIVKNDAKTMARTAFDLADPVTKDRP